MVGGKPESGQFARVELERENQQFTLMELYQDIHMRITT